MAYIAYVGQCFYPVCLLAFYPRPPGGPPAWKSAAAIAAVAGVSLAAWMFRRGYPYFFVGWFWYLGMLAPVLGLVQVADHAMADRYMYLPGIGLYLAVAWGASRLVPNLPLGRWVLLGAGATTIALLVAAATWQATFWYDDEALWSHTLACMPDNATANTALGVALARQGRHDEAIDLYEKSLEIEPNAFYTHVQLAASLGRMGRFDEAMAHVERGLQIDPRSAMAYRRLGILLAFQEKFGPAETALRKAISLEPQAAANHHDLGWTLLQHRAVDDAIAEFQAALKLDPNFVLSHVDLADALVVRNRIDEAVAHYRRALEIDSSQAEARAKLEKLLGHSDPNGPTIDVNDRPVD